MVEKRLKESEQIFYRVDGIKLEHLRVMKEHYGLKSFPAVLDVLLMEHKRFFEAGSKKSLGEEILFNATGGILGKK